MSNFARCLLEVTFSEEILAAIDRQLHLLDAHPLAYCYKFYFFGIPADISGRLLDRIEDMSEIIADHGE